MRDNEATNVKEIKDTGWAWGQIADMETWYDELRRDPGKLQGQTFSVTGYSLGGHLATAFHLLHPDDVKEVVAFNGAGVGKVKSGGLADGLRAALDTFNGLRSDPERMAFALSSGSPAIGHVLSRGAQPSRRRQLDGGAGVRCGPQQHADRWSDQRPRT